MGNLSFRTKELYFTKKQHRELPVQKLSKNLSLRTSPQTGVAIAVTHRLRTMPAILRRFYETSELPEYSE